MCSNCRPALPCWFLTAKRFGNVQWPMEAPSFDDKGNNHCQYHGTMMMLAIVVAGGGKFTLVCAYERRFRTVGYVAFSDTFTKKIFHGTLQKNLLDSRFHWHFEFSLV